MPSSSPLECAASLWHARALNNLKSSPEKHSPAAVDPSWQPLLQPWRTGQTPHGFNHGWAKITWHQRSLIYDTVFLGSSHSNKARTMNERTWELGDVCEIFIQVAGDSKYLELHVTPENQRLQLEWTADGLERVRRGDAQLSDYWVTSQDWVQSSTHIGPGYWVSRILVPVDRLGINQLSPELALQTAVCRYDYSDPDEPVQSTTAPLQAACFHRRHEWQQIVLSPAS